MKVSRFLLWFIGINTFEHSHIILKALSKLLLLVNISTNCLSLVNHFYRYRSYSFGEGVLIIVTIRPITTLGIILNLTSHSENINRLMKVLDNQEEISGLSQWRIRHLSIISLAAFVLHPVRVLYLLFFPLPDAPDYWYDIFSLARSGLVNRWIISSVYLFRTSIDYLPIITSVHLYITTYIKIQAHYRETSVFDHLVLYGSELSTLINDLKTRRLEVNHLMISFENIYNLLPLFWIIFLFVFTSLELAFYTFINPKGFSIFIAYAMPRFVTSITLTYCIAFTIHNIDYEQKLIRRFTEQYAMSLSISDLSLGDIDCGLYLIIDEPVKPTAYRFFPIQKGILLPFIGSSISFSLLFRGLFEFEFKNILRSIAKELNVTVVN